MKQLTALIEGRHPALSTAIDLQTADPTGRVRPPLYLPSNGSSNQQTYIVQQRYLNGELRDTVVLDSIPSQINRIEAALYDLYSHGRLPLPDIKVRFHDGFEISQWLLPHRIYDAVIRYSHSNGTKFFKSDLGKPIEQGDPAALFRYAPNTLVFGGWHSHIRGVSPEHAPKFSRVITAEIIGFDPIPVARTTSRRDPLGLPGSVKVPDALKKDLKEDKKGGELSKLGLGYLPPKQSDIDVAIRSALHAATISLVALRNLPLPVEAKAILLGLALLGVSLQYENGYRLRSGTDLVPKPPLAWKILSINGSGESVEGFATETLLKEIHALLEALPADLRWPPEPIVLEPSPALQSIYDQAKTMTLEERAARKSR